MKAQALLISLLTVTVVLAGCTDSGDDDNPEVQGEIDPETFDLGNKGAISGLVVDDNYRPVQLKEDWGDRPPGDFQDIGFVLILETAQRFETTENGEFQVLPLKPGKYTIRVAADNHEAIDKQVTVVSGEFTEVTVEARRQYSGGGTILSQEEVLFSSCYASTLTNGVALASIAPCNADLSGDSGRFDFWTTQLVPIKEDVRGMVTELRTNDDGEYSLTIRLVDDFYGAECPSWCRFGEIDIEDGRYGHVVLYPDLQHPGPEGGEYLEEGQEGYCKYGEAGPEDLCDNYGWTLDIPFQSALFATAPNGEYFEPVCQATEPVRDAYNANPMAPLGIGCRSVGVVIGVKAQVVQNVFLYELPENGIEDYCVLCEDADIPE